MTGSDGRAATTAPGLLVRGGLAGVAGGLLAGMTALVVAWPALDAAVALEEAAAAAHAAAGIAHDGGVVVGRGTQRVGGLVGLILVGVVIGVGLAFAQGLAAGRRGAAASWSGPFRRSLQLGLAVLVAVVVVPQVLYPPLPPGATASGGDHLAAVTLGVGVVAAHALARHTARERGALAPVAEVGLVVGAVALTLAGAWLLPDRSADVALPAELLWDFRVGAIAVQVVLVTATAALLGVFLDLAQRRARLRTGAGAPAAGTGATVGR